MPYAQMKASDDENVDDSDSKIRSEQRSLRHVSFEYKHVRCDSARPNNKSAFTSVNHRYNSYVCVMASPHRHRQNLPHTCHTPQETYQRADLSPALCATGDRPIDTLGIPRRASVCNSRSKPRAANHSRVWPVTTTGRCRIAATLAAPVSCMARA